MGLPKILAQIDVTAQARVELEKAVAKMLLGFRNILTSDQWAKLQAEERDNRRSRMRGGPGGSGAPGGPGGAGPGGPGGPEGMLSLPNRDTPQNSENALADLLS